MARDTRIDEHIKWKNGRGLLILLGITTFCVRLLVGVGNGRNYLVEQLV